MDLYHPGRFGLQPLTLPPHNRALTPPPMRQILGTGFGSLLGLLILRIFLDVGGYSFNPYGMVCLLALGKSLLSFSVLSRGN